MWYAMLDRSSGVINLKLSHLESACMGLHTAAVEHRSNAKHFIYLMGDM